MDKENKDFTKNEERSFVISMILTLQMDRKVEKKHYIIPGSYELSWKDEYIPFDFFASNINFIENDLISFCVDNIDTTAFPGTKQKLTKDFLQNCSISECYIYTGESEVEPEIHPGELLRLIEVGASCFNHYCVGCDVTQLNVLHNVHRRISLG